MIDDDELNELREGGGGGGMQVMSEEKEEKKKGDVGRKNEKLPCLTLSFPPRIPHRHIQFCSLQKK